MTKFSGPFMFFALLVTSLSLPNLCYSDSTDYPYLGQLRQIEQEYIKMKDKAEEKKALLDEKETKVDQLIENRKSNRKMIKEYLVDLQDQKQHLKEKKDRQYQEMIDLADKIMSDELSEYRITKDNFLEGYNQLVQDSPHESVSVIEELIGTITQRVEEINAEIAELKNIKEDIAATELKRQQYLQEFDSEIEKGLKKILSLSLYRDCQSMSHDEATIYFQEAREYFEDNIGEFDKDFNQILLKVILPIISKYEDQLRKFH